MAQINTIPFEADFETSIAPFDAGAIVDATGWGKALQVSNTTATAVFGESVSALTANDEVTIQFNALHGWEGSNKTTKIALLNTDGDELISYTYDITKCNVVDVSIGGATVNGFAAFMGQANFNNNKSANGFTHSQHYVTTEGYTPVVKFVVSGAGMASFSFAYTAAKSTTINKTFSASLGDKKANLGKIVITDNQPSADRCFGMDNLSITKETKVTYAYTIKYVDENDKTIKTSEGRAEAGTQVAIDKESFWVEGKKYKYVSDDSETKLISAEGENIITVKVTEAPKYNYSVKDNVGNTLAEGAAYEGEDIVYYVPYFVYKESIFYKSPTLSAGTLSYGQSTISSISADTNITVTYTEEDESTVIFYAEAENLKGITLVDDQYTQIRMSNGKAGYFAAKTAIETLPMGKYTITAATRSGTTKFYAGNAEVLDLTSSGAVVETTSNEFALGKDTEIFTSIGSASAYFDYIIIRMTGVVTPAEAAVINAKAALKIDLDAAKAIDTTGKEGVEALSKAINDAETAIADAEATVESVTAAQTALAAAVIAFKQANNETLLTLKAKVGEEVTLTFGAWNAEDTYTVDFGDGKLQSAKVGIDNKGPVKEDGTTGSATKFTGTVAGDGTIKVYGYNDIWYFLSSGGATPTTFDQAKLMNVVQMSITGADVESVVLPAYTKMTQFSFNNSSVKSVDVTKVTSLTSLTINSTTASLFDPQLESIDLSHNTELTYLSLQGNNEKSGKLTSLDLTNNTKLDGMGLYVQYNALTEIKFGANTLSAINVQNNQLTSLDWTKLTGLKNIYASNNKLAGEVDLSANAKFENVQLNNNELTSVKLPDVTKVLAIEGNKLTLATIPAQPAGMNTASKTKKFTYAPQAALEVPATVTNLDLSAQATVEKGELDPTDYATHLTSATAFSFVTKSGTALVQGTDYKVTAKGKFVFTKAQSEKVHGVMLNEALPKFTAAAPFTTTEFTVEPATGDTDLMTEAKALAADADAVAVGKLIDAIAAAEESGDETELAAAVEQFKTDNAATKTVEANVTNKVGTSKDSWTGATGTYSKDGIGLVERYGTSDAGVMMSQEVTVDNGTYDVKLYATSHNAWNGGGATLQQDANDVAYVFATSGETTTKTWITARRNSGMIASEPEIYTVEEVAVADGKLTMGLALDKSAQTEWHTIQIAALEKVKVVTAKEAWAIVKAELQKSIDAATDTLKTGEKGKTELEAAIEVAKIAKASNKLNVDEVVAAKKVLDEAIHEFFEANLKIREAIYYVQETSTGKFLSRGSYWGTHAVVDDYGVPVELTYVPDGKYTIKGIDNNSTYGFDGDVYSDASGTNIRSFIFTEVEGGYTLTNTNNSKFVAIKAEGADSLGLTADSDKGSVFKLLSMAERDAIVAANKKAIEDAAIEAAGFKASDPLVCDEKIDTLTFKTGSNWTFTPVRDKSKADTNENGTEVFQGTGSFAQNVEGLDKGLYRVTVQAMYRDGANGNVAKLYDQGYNLSHAYLDANGSRVQVKSWAADRKSDSNPNTMGEFATLAGEGKYVSEGFAAVAADGKLNLTVAVPSYIGSGWFIASQVTYQKVTVDSVSIYRAELQAAITKAEAADTLNKTQESIDALKAAIAAAKAAVAKEDATAAELKAAKKALEDAVAALVFKPLELAEGTIYGWELGMEAGGKAVASDEQSVAYPTAGYTTIRLNGAKDFSTNVITITLDNAVSAGDTIKVTAFRNKNAKDKTSGFKAKFENGDKVVSSSTGLEFVNIDTSDASAEDSNRGTEPNTCEFIVPEEAAGSKVITITRSHTSTNLFITKLYINQKQFEKKTYEGFVAISAAPAASPSTPMAPATTAAQTVKIAQTAEVGKVNITFSGFQLAPMPFQTGELTLAATATANVDGSISYTSEAQTVSIMMGQMAASYTATIKGTQASADATPVLVLQLSQASIFTVVFAETEDAAKNKLDVVTGIENVKAADANAKSIYNMNGQKVTKTQKGMYIINGKKVIVK